MRAITAFSAAVSSRRWKPSRRQELRGGRRAGATAVLGDSDFSDSDSDSDSESDFAGAGDSDDKDAYSDADEYARGRGGDMLTIEASYSSVASSTGVTDSHVHSHSHSHSHSSSSGSVVRTPSSVTSSLVLLEYPSLAHAGSSSSLTASSHSHRAGDDAALAPAPRTAPLYPVLVVPQHVPRATEILLFLSRIEYVEINTVVEREDSVVYYVLDVFRHRQQNGIPTRRRAASTASASKLQPPRLTHSTSAGTGTGTGARLREPDYQIEHRYSSFARLRSNVWQAARRRHRRGRACGYCGALQTFFAESDAQPSLRVKFTTTTETRKALLSKFVNDLLAATREDHAQCPRVHRGVHQVPALMRRFLKEQTGETFFS